MTEQLDGFDPRSTYDEAAHDYESAARDFWQYISIRTVELLDLKPGDRVLDVPCGSGASLVAAAQRVGPSGRVVGVDYAEQMVAVAGEKARSGGLVNVELSVADMTCLDERGLEPFDAVVCSLGLFFAEDMGAFARSLFGLVRPGGGRLGVAVFGERVFDPMRQVFAETVGNSRQPSRSSNPGVAPKTRPSWATSSRRRGSTVSRSRRGTTSCRSTRRTTGGGSFWARGSGAPWPPSMNPPPESSDVAATPTSSTAALTGSPVGPTTPSSGGSRISSGDDGAGPGHGTPRRDTGARRPFGRTHLDRVAVVRAPLLRHRRSTTTRRTLSAGSGQPAFLRYRRLKRRNAEPGPHP